MGPPNNAFTVKDIEKLIPLSKVTIIGERKRRFDNVCSLQNGNPGSLSFCSTKGSKAVPLLEESKAGVILCCDDVKPSIQNEKTLILVENPRLWFIRCANYFFPTKQSSGIHPSAIIGKNCLIDGDVFVGPYSVIGNNVTVQSETIISSHVQIHDDIKIGKGVKIKSGCVIGSEGFGYEKNEVGEYERFPHLGSVVIEDRVEIGANTCIDRGALSNTIIGEGTKIDNLVHIAHNVEIGRNCAIVCLSCIAGSVKIGDGAWIAPLAVIRNGIQIGAGAIVGMGAVVTKDVEPYDVVAGVPAKSIKEKKG